VIEGRDICTRVVPNADVKVFLTAAFEERARRRFRELREKGYDVTLEAVEDEVRKRDEIDSTRVSVQCRRLDRIWGECTGHS
jgi:cytidylate kinase